MIRPLIVFFVDLNLKTLKIVMIPRHFEAGRLFQKSFEDRRRFVLQLLISKTIPKHALRIPNE